MDNNDGLQDIARKQAEWQKTIKKRHQLRQGEFITDPAAAPVSTDQEAGGAVSTPDGDRKYDSFGHAPARMHTLKEKDMELTPHNQPRPETKPPKRRDTSMTIMVLLMLCLIGACVAFFGPAIIGIFRQQLF